MMMGAMRRTCANTSSTGLGAVFGRTLRPTRGSKSAGVASRIAGRFPFVVRGLDLVGHLDVAPDARKGAT